MFSQEIINDYVSIDIILSVAVAVLIGIYCLYRWIDYLLFCRRLEKSYRKERERKAKNPLE